jgi:hypothetical protein
MIKSEKKKTPSQIMGGMISATMSFKGISAAECARGMGLSTGTVYKDIADPERIPQDRLWRYFIFLGVPIQDALEKIANSVATMMIQR